MGRVKQPKGSKGSLKWIQVLMNEYPQKLNTLLNEKLGRASDLQIEWLSPLKMDDYAEYRDQPFLDRLEVTLPDVPLNQFWPKNGPQWDALGRIENEAYFLVEAKAHISELISSSQTKSPRSESLINQSLVNTQKCLGLNPQLDLKQGFYQYANRLAHLYLLRILNDIPAYMIFVYFINDPIHIRTTKVEWYGALQLMHSLLGDHNHKLSRYTVDVFIDVKDL